MTPGTRLIAMYLASALLCAVSGMVLYRRRVASPGAGKFAPVLFLETWWCLAGTAELVSPSLGAKILWDDAQLIPALFVPIEMLLFARAYVDRAPVNIARTRLSLSALPLVCAAFVFTDPLHGSARATARIVPSEPFDALMYEFSAIEWLAFAYTYVLLITVGVLLVKRIFSEHRVFRFQTGVTLFAMLLPSAMSLLMLFDVRVYGQRDFTPLVFGVSGALIATSLSRRRFLDLVPIARDAVVESVSDAVVLLDARHRLVDANAAARALLGRSVDVLFGQDVAEVHPSLAALLGAHVTDGAEPREVVLDTKDGARTFDVTISEVRDAPRSVLGVAMLLRDVTERRLAADALRQANDALEARVRERTIALEAANQALTLEMGERLRSEQERSALELQLQAAQKMESMGRLAGGVAHDFNNLLTAILCNVELIARKTKHDPKLMELLDPVRRAGESATGLTRQLLAFSRNQIVEPKHLEIDTSIAKVQKMLERIIGEDVNLAFAPGASGRYVLCDVGQLEQLLMNLAVNARDAIGMGGAITLATARTHVEAARVCADGSTLAPGDYVTVSVRDTGSGIAPEVLARIFDPFFTTKPEGRGTGLGLSVVRDVVRQNGGSIDVDTTLGAGTTFRVHFPEVDAPRDARMVDQPMLEPPRGKERILLVEDQSLVREAIARTLERLGYGVTACETAKSGLDVVRGPANGGIDLLVTDVVLADGSGRRLAESAQSHAPRLAVLFVSGYTDDIVLKHGIAHGDLKYLAKPFSERELAVAVRRALDQRTMS